MPTAVWSRWGLFGILTAIVFYFSYHLFCGQRGYFSLLEKKERLLCLQKEYQETQKEHDSFLHKVQLMQDEIDPDLLTQQAWILLRHVDPDKFVILQKND